MCRELEDDCPVARLPHARGPPAVLRAWGLLLSSARDMKSARRSVSVELRTGEDLWTRLRKAACDAYGRTETSMPYVPFEAMRIKRFSGEYVPELQVLDHLPGRIASDLSTPSVFVRSFNDEDWEIWGDLQKRYNHVGGEHREFVKYLHRECVDTIWDYYLQQGLERWAADLGLPGVGNAAVMAVLRAKGDLLRRPHAPSAGNYALRSPKEVYAEFPDIYDMGLVGGGVLSRVFAPRDVCHWAGMDQDNCFISWLLPFWMQLLQAGPALKVSEVPPYRRLAHWKETGIIRAIHKRASMGSGISVFITMAVNLAKAAMGLARHPDPSTFLIVNLRDVRCGGHRITAE